MRGAVFFALLLFVSIAVVAEARSAGAPASTVVSGDGCTCHSQQPNAGTVVSVAAPGQYLGATRHSIRVTSTTDVVNVGDNEGGFLAWVSHGTFAKRDGSEDWYIIESLDGKSVIKHNLAGDQANEAQEWRFDWVPPTTDVGTVTLKVWVNRVNGDGGASELDHWNRKTVTMTAEPHADPGPTSPTMTTVATTPSTASPPGASSAPDTSRSQGQGGAPGAPFWAALAVVAVMVFILRRRD